MKTVMKVSHIQMRIIHKQKWNSDYNEMNFIWPRSFMSPKLSINPTYVFGNQFLPNPPDNSHLSMCHWGCHRDLDSYTLCHMPHRNISLDNLDKLPLRKFNINDYMLKYNAYADFNLIKPIYTAGCVLAICHVLRCMFYWILMLHYNVPQKNKSTWLSNIKWIVVGACLTKETMTENYRQCP